MTVLDAKMSPAELNSLLAQVGHTPMKKIRLVIDGHERTVHLKLEGANPGGSIKDRTAFGLISDLEGRGLLTPGSRILDSTSGNLGVALAYMSRAKGYQFTAVVDPKTTPENIEKMTRFGAEIEMVDQPDDTGNFLLARLEKVKMLTASRGDVWTNQYSNPANPRAHYEHTAPEIWTGMHGRVGAVFVAVSTGGTLAGIARYFRAVSPRTRIVGVDAAGSVVFGGMPGPRRLTGIGASRPSSFLTHDLYDNHMLIDDQTAFCFCRALFSATGIRVGGSSGAVLAACARYLQSAQEVESAVCLCPDRGENYLSSIFDDGWMTSQGLSIGLEHLHPVTDITLSSGGRRVFVTG